MTGRPLLFLAMPFGTKSAAGAKISIDFDDVYTLAIQPAARDADAEVIRADEERGGGISTSRCTSGCCSPRSSSRT